MQLDERDRHARQGVHRGDRLEFLFRYHGQKIAVANDLDDARKFFDRRRIAFRQLGAVAHGLASRLYGQLANAEVSWIGWKAVCAGFLYVLVVFVMVSVTVIVTATLVKPPANTQ